MGYAGSASAQDAFYPIAIPSTIASFQGGMVIDSQMTAISAITFNSLGFIDVINNRRRPITTIS